MTNSNDHTSSSRVTTIIARLFDDSKRIILTRRLADAARSYRRPTFIAIDFSTFNNELSHFIMHIYTHGLDPPRHLDNRTALAEAIGMLKRSEYAQSGRDSYECAYIDVMQRSNDGLASVLQNLLEVLTDEVSRDHENLKYAELIDPTDTALHVEILQWIAHHYRDRVPINGEADDAVYWSGHYRQLLEEIREAQKTTTGIITGDLFLSAETKL